MNGTEIERVSQTKLLGVIISSDLKWDAHIAHINAKASKRLFYIRQLKYAGLTVKDLVRVYKALVRPVCEYACPVWSTCLPKCLSDILESIQSRALKIILPHEPYEVALDLLNLQTLLDRREQMCSSLFNEISSPSHRLHSLMPEKRSVERNLRHKTNYELPKWKTKRYKNSFIPWCIKNCQV